MESSLRFLADLCLRVLADLLIGVPANKQGSFCLFLMLVGVARNAVRGPLCLLLRQAARSHLSAADSVVL